MKNIIERLAPAMENVNKAGTCEHVVAILETVPKQKQIEAAMKFSSQFVQLATMYKSFVDAVPEAVEVAQDNIALEASFLD